MTNTPDASQPLANNPATSPESVAPPLFTREENHPPARGWKKVLAIAGLFFREMVRDKVFITLSAAGVLLVFAALILGEMTVGEKGKAVKDLGLSVLNLMIPFVLIFSGVQAISGDLSRKTLYFIFARPIRRGHYLMGASAALFSVALCGVLIILTVLFLLLGLQGENWIGGSLYAGALAIMELLILLAFAMLFSVSLSPQLAMFLTLLIYIIGHTAQKAAQIVENSQNTILKYAVLIISALAPNLEFFNKKTELIYNIPIPTLWLLHALLYSASYSVLILMLAAYALNRREI